MKIFKFIGDILNPVTKMVDDLHTSEEERLGVKTKLFELQTQMTIKVMEYESQLLESKTKIITAEANGASWLQRSWRPITMLSFLGLVVADAFGWTQFRLAEEAWTLLQIGLGGYVVGRSVEKVAPKVVEVMRKD